MLYVQSEAEKRRIRSQTSTGKKSVVRSSQVNRDQISNEWDVLYMVYVRGEGGKASMARLITLA